MAPRKLIEDPTPETAPAIEKEIETFHTLLQTVVPDHVVGRRRVFELLERLQWRVLRLEKAYREIQKARAKELRESLVWRLFEQGTPQTEIAALAGLHKESVNRLLRQLIKEKTGRDQSPLQYRDTMNGSRGVAKAYENEIRQLERGAPVSNHERHKIDDGEARPRIVIEDPDSGTVIEPPSDDWQAAPGEEGIKIKG